MTGSIVLATEQGLGYLARDFYDNGVIDMVCVHPHSTRKNHYEWYPGHVSRETLLEKCDTLIFFETPFDWRIIREARERGIRTVLIPMYECTRFPFPYEPDEVWTPSALDTRFYGDKTTKEVTIPVPNRVKWKLRRKALVFVHNAGNGGLGGRNGTKELVEAFRHVKSDARLIVRSQVPVMCDDPRIDVRIGTFDDIWDEGDVFVFPEKFNGLSLPLQEAFASGMAVMAGDRFPMNEWLPAGMLIPVSGYHRERIAVEFDCAEYDPKEIAATIDSWYGRDISEFSLLGKQFNEKNSWKKLRETYETRRSA